MNDKYIKKNPDYMMISYQKRILKRKGNKKEIQDNGNLKGKKMRKNKHCPLKCTHAADAS